MPSGKPIRLRLVETLYYVDLRTLRIQNEFLKPYTADLKPGEFRAFTNERETRWRCVICLDQGEYWLGIPTVDAKGQIKLYIEHAGFLGEVAIKAGTRKELEELTSKRVTRYQKYLARKRKMDRAKKAKQSKKKTTTSKKKSKGPKRKKQQRR